MDAVAAHEMTVVETGRVARVIDADTLVGADRATVSQKSGDAALRFSAHVEGLTRVIGHADRSIPGSSRQRARPSPRESASGSNHQAYHRQDGILNHKGNYAEGADRWAPPDDNRVCLTLLHSSGLHEHVLDSLSRLGRPHS
jgi:hypothetical protein